MGERKVSSIIQVIEMKVEVHTYKGTVDKVLIDGKCTEFEVKDYDDSEEEILTFYNNKDYYTEAGEINRERKVKVAAGKDKAWKIYDGTDDGRGIMWSEHSQYEFYDGTKAELLENMKRDGWEMEE
jgi:hypothetical protein